MNHPGDKLMLAMACALQALLPHDNTDLRSAIDDYEQAMLTPDEPPVPREDQADGS